MKKLITLLTSHFLLLTFFSYSQAPAAKPKAAAVAAVNAKDSMLCQDWKLTGVDVFGVKKAPDVKLKNDGVNFSPDKSATLIIEGKTFTGTYAINKPKTIITFTDNVSKEIMTFNIIALEKNDMTLFYKDKDWTKWTFFYNPAKK